MTMWTIYDALELVRCMQRSSMEAGYYIALAGSVINKGHSENDVDLIAVPRRSEVNHADLIATLKKHMGGIKKKWRIHNGSVLAFTLHDGRKTEVVLLDQPWEK